MAEDSNKQYSYHAMSNKVEMADRSLLKGRSNEPTGEVETLRGREGIGRMGDRAEANSVAGSRRADRSRELRDSSRRKRQKHKHSTRSPAPEDSFADSSGQSILDVESFERYRPSTQMARTAFETLLTTIGSKVFLGSQPPSILRDATDGVIRILKNDTLRDPERLEQLSKLLSTNRSGITKEQYGLFVRLSKQLDDFTDSSHTSRGSRRQGIDGDSVNDEMGVAVVFESDEGSRSNGSGESDIEEGVVADSSSDSEDGSEEDERHTMLPLDKVDDSLVQGGVRKKSQHAMSRELNVHEIDAHFLQRQIGRHIDDAQESARLANEVLQVLDIRNNFELRQCENKLLLLLNFELFDTIKLLLNNRVRIWGCVSIKRAQSSHERSAIADALMKESSGEGKLVWDQINSKSRAEDWSKERMRSLAGSLHREDSQESVAGASKSKGETGKGGKDEVTDVNELDLERLAFQEGGHFMSTNTCDLPESSWRAMKKGYEEVHVPAVKSVVPSGEKLIPISNLPIWAQHAFKGVEKLNRVQSKLYEAALMTSENILLCAPTGAGKTNVACLTMLNILGQYRKQRLASSTDEEKAHVDSFDLGSFKIVYISPMKALVQEQVKNFSHRLKDYGIVVKELSGDSSLSRQQISETQLLVTTPEKWDIVTRQGEGRSFAQLVKLVIIDEIHLLHDSRGPVLESIVARIVRQVETTAEPTRLVGLSATLPNYSDVAAFLRVKPDKGLFFFDHSYRPVPLQMQYAGITERNAFKRFQLQNQICYEKSLAQRQSGNQVLIFVHSRIETAKTARALRDLALERDELSNFVREGSPIHNLLRTESSSVKNTDLKDILQYGFAIHHAGMARQDRELVEDLFADRHIGVLCTTATLAWGVNLPAHAVIIKGTQIYDPAKSQWTELSPLDIMQMLGRAGRPQYDSEGEGLIITQHSELKYYLSLTNVQLPVDSQLIKTLPDHLNAEIVLGTVQSIQDAAEWLSYTFLYVRMIQRPELYGSTKHATQEDSTLRNHRMNLAHSAAIALESNHLIRYDRKTGAIQSTPLGRVASQFYISHSSMAVYNRHMRANMSEIDLLRLFAMSSEFSQITVREEEKLELARLAARVPVPIKENPSESSAKVNILLQAYISRLKLEGFALIADMAFVQQSAGRIMRCLFEIALRRRWAPAAKLILAMSNMVAHRIWRSQSPIRQFKSVPNIVAKKLERKSDIEWSRYRDLTVSDLGEVVGVPKMGRVLQKLVHRFPRLEIMSVQAQPLTRSLLRIELALVPAFKFDIEIHGTVQLFHVVVEDVNCEVILHHEYFSVRHSEGESEHVLVFSVSILDPMPPAYFVRVTSDRWLHSEAVMPISFKDLVLPARFPPPTELLDLHPLLPSAVGEDVFSGLFSFGEFNPIQTQTFPTLFKTEKNCLVCAPSGSGKTVCAEFALIRMLAKDPEGKCIYVAPTEEIVELTASRWREKFGPIIGQSNVSRLTGEIGADLATIASSRLVFCAIDVWDRTTRRWKQRKALHKVSLIVFDEIQFLGSTNGPALEIVLARMRYMSSFRQENGIPKMRLVALGGSIANARDIGEWIGVPTECIFNFSPMARPWPLEVYFQAFEHSSLSGRLLAMARPLYSTLLKHLDGNTSIVYVPSRRQAQLVAIDLMTHGSNKNDPFFNIMQDDSEQNPPVREAALKQVLKAGIGFLHGGMIQSEWRYVIDMYNSKKIKILIVPADLCWRVNCVAHLVVIMGTEAYDGRERRHVDYPMVDLLHMMGRYQPSTTGKCVVMCHHAKKEVLKKLLYEPLPVESHLDRYLHDHIVSETVTRTIETMQDAVDYLTWTFLYRRLPKNPSYYGLRGTSSVHISEFLSEMVETIIGDLEESNCLKINDDGEISPLNLGMIAAYYGIQYKTVDIIASSVTPKTRVKGLLEVLSASWEFESLQIRFNEAKTIERMGLGLPMPTPTSIADVDVHTKALVLLQCHFSRKVVPADLRIDQKLVLKQAMSLIPAMVDVISSSGWLKPALAAIEVSQMIVQGLWNKDHALKQIPHFSDEVVDRCLAGDGENAVESVFDILTLDDDVRNNLLRLPDHKMADVAMFCNKYPNVEMSFELKNSDGIVAGETVELAVALERDVDEDDLTDEELLDLGTVSAPLFPQEKKESWWIVIGDTSTNILYGLKRVSLQERQTVVLRFAAPSEPGDYRLTLILMSDSYMGCDQEYSQPLSVAPNHVNDESSESSDD